MATTKKPAAKKAAPKKAAAPKAEAPAKASLSPIGIDPAEIKLTPGNTVTFYCEDPGAERVSATIAAGGGTSYLRPARSSDRLTVSKIIERAGNITVEFYADGKLFASDTFTVD